MKTHSRPELKERVHAFSAKLHAADEFIPIAELAALFGADDSLRAKAAERGNIRFVDDRFMNDGPELVIPAGAVELEIPNLIRGRYVVSEGGFTLTFPSAEFTLRACVKIAILRKCFDLKEMRADAGSLEIDFGNDLANRRYEF